MPRQSSPKRRRQGKLAPLTRAQRKARDARQKRRGTHAARVWARQHVVGRD